MAATCTTCGQKLSTGERVKRMSMCGGCNVKAKAEEQRAAAEAKAALDAAVSEYPKTLALVAGGPAVSAVAVTRMRELEATIARNHGNFGNAKAAFYRSCLDQALADEQLTQEEETSLDKLAKVLFPEAQQNVLMSVLAPYRAQFLIARVNAGRLPVMSNPTILLKRGETQHLAEQASLLKEVVDRELRGRSQGMSFRIAKGVTYRVGAYKGHMVEVGRHMELADSGVLAVTSHRVVFGGTRKTLEIPYSKLVDLNVFTDGIQFQASNRQNPPMFRVASGPIIAAVVTAAMQRFG